MKNIRFLCLAALLFIPCLLSASNQTLVGARFPALSPDGRQIAFGYMGDIWVVASEGGQARRLTDHEAYDMQPVWSPDGQWIAFTSNRHGNNDVFVISTQGGQSRRLTWHTTGDVATDWTPDGKFVIFSSGRTSSISLYKIPAEGGNPTAILDTYWSWPYGGKVSPDGNEVLFAQGMENRFWWRTGYRGSNASQIWSMPMKGGQAVQRFGDEANGFSPHWGADGQSIYFLSDRSGVYNIWKKTPGSQAEAVTRFKKDNARLMNVSRNGKAAVYERQFRIWYTDLTSGQSRAVEIEAPSEYKSNPFEIKKDGRVSEYALSPDGKKLAAVVRGDIFVLDIEGEYAANITDSPSRESNVIWSDDSRHVIYVSDAGANPNIYKKAVLGDEAPQQLTRTALDVMDLQLSPDGKQVAYYNGPRELRVMDTDGKNNKAAAIGDFGGRFGWGYSWAPDSKHLAVVEQVNGQRDIFAVSIEGGEKIALTNTAYDETNPVWHEDGKSVIFASNRSGHSFPEMSGQYDIYQVHLVPKQPEFKVDDFEKLFAEEKKDGKDKESKSDDKKKEESITITFQLDNLDTQTEPVVRTLGQDRSFIMAPGDKENVYFVTSIDGSSHLWKTSLEEKERGKFKPFAAGVKNPGALQVDKKGGTLYYLSGGKLGSLDLKSGKGKPISFKHEVKVDKQAEYQQMLAEVYYVLEHYYYDENHHGIDWTKLYERYKPVLAQVREDADFYDYANMMIGHLNSSHTGINAPFGGRPDKPTAHVGAEWKVDNAVTIAHIYKDSPLWQYRDSVKVGDRLLAVNGKAVSADKNIYRLFNGLMDKKVTLSLQSAQYGKMDVVLKPVSVGVERSLRREEWIDQRKAMVKKASNDEVAYIYMQAMGYGDLTRFLRELERDAVPRKGLILDLRYNMGGNVHDRVLDALVRPSYGLWQVRGLKRTPQSTFGFADKPVVLLTNEVTLSDGEMTTAGFKAMKRGTVVGNTTYGWLIFTTSSGLLNGGSFRLPFWGCYSPDGTDLETHGGVKPDVTVINDLNDDLSGRDPQLEKALEIIGKSIK